jgi:endonuclease/exonuclease/phosphatase family metal-dependent hydrolase
MTFNIQGADNGGKGANTWGSRAALNVRTIKRYAPDLIGFQEVQDGNLRTYREQMREYEYMLGPRAGNREPYDYNPIFWNPTRLSLLDAGGFWLSRTPDRHSADWDTAWIRSATWARLRCIDRDLDILHLNTHLDHISELARVRGSELILDKLAELGGTDIPTILTGDFNCNPWPSPDSYFVETTYTDRCYHIFLDHGFVDTFTAAGYADGWGTSTFHGFEGSSYSPAQHHMAGRVDWILTRDGVDGFRTEAYRIVRDAETPTYPSDHYPVLAELRLVPAQSRGLVESTNT